MYNLTYGVQHDVDEDSVVPLDVLLLASSWNPLERSDIWTSNIVSPEMVRSHISSKDLLHLCFDEEMEDDGSSTWTTEMHAARVAYLVVNGWDDDPIDVDFGVPSLGFRVGWPIINGNHRLAAAIIRGDKSIAAAVSGEVFMIDKYRWKDELLD